MSQEFDLDTRGWDAFWERFAALAEDVPQQKRAMLEKVGLRINAEVWLAMGRSRLRDTTGRVAKYQTRHMGSGGGYVAVRADSVEVEAGGSHSQRINAGALTNFLTSGHRVRPPSGRSARYRPRANMSRVPGFDFYQKAAGRAQAIGLEEAQRLLEELEKELTK